VSNIVRKRLHIMMHAMPSKMEYVNKIVMVLRVQPRPRHQPAVENMP
jgi:hypothetical protein